MHDVDRFRKLVARAASVLPDNGQQLRALMIRALSLSELTVLQAAVDADDRAAQPPLLRIAQVREALKVEGLECIEGEKHGTCGPDVTIDWSFLSSRPRCKCLSERLGDERFIAYLERRFGPVADARDAWRAEIEHACARVHEKADRRQPRPVVRAEPLQRLADATTAPGRPVPGAEHLRVVDGGKSEPAPAPVSRRDPPPAGFTGTGREWLSQSSRGDDLAAEIARIVDKQW